MLSGLRTDSAVELRPYWQKWDALDAVCVVLRSVLLYEFWIGMGGGLPPSPLFR
jgi:hypothetical protein